MGLTFGMGLALGASQPAEARSPSRGASNQPRNYCTTGDSGTLCCVNEAGAAFLARLCLRNADPVQCVITNAALGNCEMR